MRALTVKEKLKNIEAEVTLLKTAFMKKPDFDVDETNWQKIKSSSQKARAKLFKEWYT